MIARVIALTTLLASISAAAEPQIAAPAAPKPEAATPTAPAAEMSAPGPAPGMPATRYERTEQREPCADYRPLRQPLFGDLHVHTSLSFDSYISSQRNTPADAYRYARGEAITLPDADANQVIKARIQRPLDFTAVTDHAEFLGPIRLCTSPPRTPRASSRFDTFRPEPTTGRFSRM